MANRLTCRIVTPEKEAFRGEVRKVVLPGVDGEVAFLLGHAPYVGLLGYGEARLTTIENHIVRFAVYGGFVRVGNDEVLVAAEGAEPSDKIHQDAALTEQREAKEALAALAPTAPEVDREAAEQRYARAQARVLAGERQTRHSS